MALATVVEAALDEDELEAIAQLRAAFPCYLTDGGGAPRGYARPRSSRPLAGPRLRFAPELRPRADTVRYARRCADAARAAGAVPASPGRLSYLRATYAAVGEPLVDGAGPLLASERLAACARAVFGGRVVVPQTLLANVYLPGQLLLPHTDVPAFRGAERWQCPDWLLVAMHHSGRFDRYRIPVATVVVYPTPSQGGALRWYAPAGGDPSSFEPVANSACALDGDTVFHGVDPVAGRAPELAELGRGAFLEPAGDGWLLCRDVPEAEHLASYAADEVRFSVSWKAYVFADADELATWTEHSDDLVLGDVVATLTDELCERGVLAGPDHGLPEARLAGVLIDELIPFPTPGS